MSSAWSEQSGPSSAASTIQATWVAVRRALTPADRPFGVSSAARTVVAVGVCAALGLLLRDPAALGLMYFGAACAAVFVTAGVFRARALALLSQGLGAVAGLSLGALSAVLPGKIAVAAVVAMACGMVGTIGPMFTAGAVMAVIGVAYAQFSGLDMPWWEKSAWYLVGTAIVSIPALLPWLKEPWRYERAAVADVFRASAELLEAIGTAEAPRRRAELAASSAAARSAVLDYRLSTPERFRALLADFATSKQTALHAAACYIAHERPPAEAIREIRDEEERVRAGIPAAGAGGAGVADDDMIAVAPWRTRAAAALRQLGRRGPLLAGARLAWCMSIATALAGVLHHQGHAYWLPLTVAVVVRTEYASVFVRTVNRLAGTLAGAIVAILALLAFQTGWPLVIVATASIAFAVLAAPKLYALSVVGVTASALLSACFASADREVPFVRLGDTLIGCAVALVFGYLLWPGRRALPDDAHLGVTARLVIAYLRRAVAPEHDPGGLPVARDEAYRVAHKSRAALTAAMAEPSPAAGVAESSLPAAIALEDAVDGITMLSAAVAAGAPPPSRERVRDVERSIRRWAIPGEPRESEPPVALIRALLGAGPHEGDTPGAG